MTSYIDLDERSRSHHKVKNSLNASCVFLFPQARTNCIPAGQSGQCTNIISAPCPTGNDVCCADGNCESDSIGSCVPSAQCTDPGETIVVGTCQGNSVCCAFDAS